ncbi:hypothetical protein L873DRAFT_1812911 [Choiromyces venosus 120613-1]|uniref:Uncharacterized protein n=1 Tax=Choiromyces venosus 120613-1 TaxID=1336337 RepID=A0A3N4JB03_9PEZI|nr:hypothetical protein L873DRAFT_1812911 [Choiromyces venosus 120613-1]
MTVGKRETRAVDSFTSILAARLVRSRAPRPTAPGVVRNSETAACEDKENSEPDPTPMVNLMPKLKSGRPRKFNDTQRAEVVTVATRDTITTLPRKMREFYKQEGGKLFHG